MNLKQLEAFVKVTEGRSFSKAAKELFLTQPTISAHIASLEKELNTRLFVRNTKEVSLSEDGTVLYEYAKQMVELERKIEYAFLHEEKMRRSVLRLPHLRFRRSIFCRGFWQDLVNGIRKNSLK